ncbi:MAG: hypothetical protein ABIF77_06815 [bacterium]
MKGAFVNRSPHVLYLGIVYLTLVSVSSGFAQNVNFEELLRAKQMTNLITADGLLYGGLENGGVMIWDPADPVNYSRWTSAEGLTDNHITDLTFSGRNLWIATADGGLTRVNVSGGQPVFRQFTSNLGGRRITSVAGAIVGDSEIVYYGIEEGGVGQIIGGLAGVVYTSGEYAGLVSDSVTDLVFFQGDLWVGTTAGVSRFANITFTSASTGLPQSWVRTLHAAGDSLLLAGTNNGVARWDSAESRWNKLTGLDGWVSQIAVAENGIWALKDNGDIDERLWFHDGSDWTAVTLPIQRTRALVMLDDLWVGGEVKPAATSSQTGRVFLARKQQTGWEQWVTKESLILAVGAVAFGPDGSLWLGSENGLAVSTLTGGEWSHIADLATTENDSSGLFAYGPNINTMLILDDGEAWFNQRTAGVVRRIPAGNGQPTVEFDHLTAANSGLSSNLISRIKQHPDGPLFFLHENAGVDILLDPDRWREVTQWVQLPTDQTGLQSAKVWDVVFARRDVMWFAVAEVGVVRWDANGTAGEDDTIDWASGGFWYPPLSSLSETTYDFGETVGLAVTADGTIWAGGSGGVVHFMYYPATATADMLASFKEKTDVYFEGLLTSSVSDIELDGNGDLWVALDVGLNRIRTRQQPIVIDAYTDLVSFFSYGYADDTRYLFDIISGLPGGQVWNLASDASGRKLLVGSNQGAALLSIERFQSGTAEALTNLYLYPNPFSPGELGERLKLGGISADVTQSGGFLQGGAEVSIYNLEGQRVYFNDHVPAVDGFWEGRNLLGNLVASGMYVVKVTLAGQTAVKSLAIVR